MRVHTHIPSDAGGSVSLGADIYRQFRRGEITEKDYFVFSSALVANTAHEERPKIYPPLPGILRDYISQRISDRVQYDSTRSKQIGDWQSESFRAFDHNRYLIDHFNWAKTKCSDVGLAREVEKLTFAVERFESLKFPAQEYLNAVEVMKRDSSFRERSK